MNAPYRQMLEAAAKWYEDEEIYLVTNIGNLREAETLTDTHVGLPSPEAGDFVFYATAEGRKYKHLLRGDRIIYSRPN